MKHWVVFPQIEFPFNATEWDGWFKSMAQVTIATTIEDAVLEYAKEFPEEKSFVAWLKQAGVRSAKLYTIDGNSLNLDNQWNLEKHDELRTS